MEEQEWQRVLVERSRGREKRRWKERRKAREEEGEGRIRYSREGDLYCGMCSSNVSRGIRT